MGPITWITTGPERGDFQVFNAFGVEDGSSLGYFRVLFLGNPHLLQRRSLHNYFSKIFSAFWNTLEKTSLEEKKVLVEFKPYIKISKASKIKKEYCIVILQSQKLLDLTQRSFFSILCFKKKFDDIAKFCELQKKCVPPFMTSPNSCPCIYLDGKEHGKEMALRRNF